MRMLKLRTIGSLTAATAFFLAAFGAGESSARADDTIKHPGDHPDYKFELEPHGIIAWDDFYGGTGYGIGARGSIPFVKNGPISTINNNIGITFGMDFAHFGGCYRGIDGADCGANYLLIPVAMQWNFFVAERWSVGGEPGFFIYHGFYDSRYDDLCRDVPGCNSVSHTSVRPAFYAVGRFYFNEKISLTMRVGYPTISIGASFFM